MTRAAMSYFGSYSRRRYSLSAWWADFSLRSRKCAANRGALTGTRIIGLRSGYDSCGMRVAGDVEKKNPGDLPATPAPGWLEKPGAGFDVLSRNRKTRTAW